MTGGIGRESGYGRGQHGTELAGRQDGCARPFGPHEELSQEPQEAAKWLLVKLTTKQNQDVHQKLTEDIVGQSHLH